MPLLFAFGALTILFFICFCVTSFISYKQRFNVKYNPLSMFPYELNMDNSFKDNLFGNIFMILCAVSLLGFYAFYGFQFTNNLTKFLMAVGVLSALVFSSLTFTPLKLLRLHLFFDVTSFVLTFLVYGALFILCLNDYQLFTNNLSLVMVFVVGFFGILYFLLILNPKLSRWAYLDKEVNSDGTYYYKRPKLFPLAYTEWASMIFVLIGAILSLVESVAL